MPDLYLMSSFQPPPASINSFSSFSDSASDFSALDTPIVDSATLMEDPLAMPDLDCFPESSMVTVIVENVKFRMDCHFLQRESETLRAILASSKTDFIRLEDVTVAEFRALWRYFYEGMYNDYDPSTIEWMDLLAIANAYGFERVYRRAIAEIDDLGADVDPVDRILLAKRLNVTKWLAPAYAALCARPEAIKAAEADKLGMYTFVALVAARESFYRETTSVLSTKDRVSLVTANLRCCGYMPSQLIEGADGALKCPSCQQEVIRGPGTKEPVANNNRTCCSYGPTYGYWVGQTDGSTKCDRCQGTVVPAPTPAALSANDRALAVVKRVFDLGVDVAGAEDAEPVGVEDALPKLPVGGFTLGTGMSSSAKKIKKKK